MPYKSQSTNRQADALHERSNPGDIDRFLHKLDRSHYDTPGSVTGCACVSCNAARRVYGVREKTWRGCRPTTSTRAAAARRGARR
jgi:hypothetical protein